MTARRSRRGSHDVGVLTVYEVNGRWKWTVSDEDGAPLADCATSHDSRPGAEEQVSKTLAAMLNAGLPTCRFEVARYIAGVDGPTRASILRVVDDILAPRRVEPEGDEEEGES